MTKFPDLVIFIPGILGSILEKNGKTVWDLSIRGLYNGALLQQLQFDAPGSLDHDIGDGITAVGVVDNIGGVPGLWKLGGYSRLRDKLISDLGLQLDENYREFPYDWRRDNRVASARLAVKADEWLSYWRDLSGNSNAKIWIVAHSMGGLVARHFLECREGWKLVRSLTTIGTPHRGSGKAVDFLHAASKPGWGRRFIPGLDIARNFDSVYQLLPIYPFIVDSDGTHKVHDRSIAGIDQARAMDAAQFHSAIHDDHACNRQNAIYQAAPPRLSVVVGTDQPTIQSALVGDGGQLMMMNRDFRGMDAYGDGTVPRVSATPIGFGEEIATFVCNSHAVIAGDKVSLHHVRSYLTGAKVDLNHYREDGGPKLGLDLEDSYLASEEIEIKARSTIREQKFVAVIDDLSGGGEPRRATLYRSGEGYKGHIKLQPGLYQATISLLEREVRDIFWVLDA